MNRIDLAGLTIVSGGFALWAVVTDAVLLYLRPSMAPYLAAAGVVLVLIGLGVLAHAVAARRSAPRLDPADVESHRPSMVGWLLVLPLCVAVIVGTDALGAFAATRQVGSRTFADRRVDITEYLEASSFGGQTPALRVLDITCAVAQEDQRAALAGREIVLTGFVVTEGAPEGSFYLTRFVIGCCAGDGLPVQIEVRANGMSIPPDDAWIDAEVVVDLAASPQEPTGTDPVVADLIDLEQVDPPDEPYEYP